MSEKVPKTLDAKLTLSRLIVNNIKASQKSNFPSQMDLLRYNIVEVCEGYVDELEFDWWMSVKYSAAEIA